MTQKAERDENKEHIEVRFSEVLKYLLKEHGLTQKDLAAYLGLKPQTVSLYCMGKSYPEFTTLIKIAAYFNVSIDYLITGQKEEHKEISTELGLTSNAIDMLKKAQQKDTERDIKVMSVINHLLSNSSFYHSLFMSESHLDYAKNLFEKLEADENGISNMLQKQYKLSDDEIKLVDTRYIFLNAIKHCINLAKKEMSLIWHIIMKQKDISKLGGVDNMLVNFEIKE